jgi:hypothetical protein
MIRRAFDSDSDYAINSFVQDSPATIQAVATRLRLFKGEWFLNLDDGVPWYQEILGKSFNLPRVETIIRNRIRETEGVKELNEFSLRLASSTRLLTVSFKAATIYDDEFTDDDIVGLNPIGS